MVLGAVFFWWGERCQFKGGRWRYLWSQSRITGGIPPVNWDGLLDILKLHSCLVLHFQLTCYLQNCIFFSETLPMKVTRCDSWWTIHPESRKRVVLSSWISRREALCKVTALELSQWWVVHVRKKIKTRGVWSTSLLNFVLENRNKAKDLWSTKARVKRKIRNWSGGGQTVGKYQGNLRLDKDSNEEMLSTTAAPRMVFGPFCQSSKPRLRQNFPWFAPYQGHFFLFNRIAPTRSIRAVVWLFSIYPIDLQDHVLAFCASSGVASWMFTYIYIHIHTYLHGTVPQHAHIGSTRTTGTTRSSSTSPASKGCSSPPNTTTVECCATYMYISLWIRRTICKHKGVNKLHCNVTLKKMHFFSLRGI